MLPSRKTGTEMQRKTGRPAPTRPPAERSTGRNKAPPARAACRPDARPAARRRGPAASRTRSAASPPPRGSAHRPRCRRCRSGCPRPPAPSRFQGMRPCPCPCVSSRADGACRGQSARCLSPKDTQRKKKTCHQHAAIHLIQSCSAALGGAMPPSTIGKSGMCRAGSGSDAGIWRGPAEDAAASRSSPPAPPHKAEEGRIGTAQARAPRPRPKGAPVRLQRVHIRARHQVAHRIARLGRGLRAIIGF